jgi:hypothetical protein
MKPTLPPALESFRAELAIFYRELPRLIEERHEGKYVAVNKDSLHGTWDTFHDARQYAYMRSDLGPFLTQKIDSRFLSVLEPIFGPVDGGTNEIA